MSINPSANLIQINGTGSIGAQCEGMMPKPTLKRSLNLPLLALYGLGTTIGAGIFALVGKVAGEAGVLAPLAFLLSSLLAALTAFSFAELASRYPRSAGEALYVHKGFGSASLARLTGVLVVAAGVISASAISRASIGYLGQFLDLPGWLLLVAVILAMGLVAAWGITESVTAAAIFTVVETGALVVVIVAGAGEIPSYGARLREADLSLDMVTAGAVLGGAFIAFYAFLGFEDMVNVAEEVRDVERTMPLGIAVTLVSTAILYVLLALVAVSALPPETLAASEAPLADLYREVTGLEPTLITGVAIFAILNGALIQIIMASRVLYGLADQGLLPGPLDRINPVTRTPLVATAVVLAVVLALALAFPVEELAAATSSVALTIFATVNLALWRLKGNAAEPDGPFRIPRWLPFAGAVVSIGFLVAALAQWVMR